MLSRKADPPSRYVVPLAFSLASLACLCGLFFFMVKGPKEKSDSYLAIAIAAKAEGRYDAAAAAALESVRLDPEQAQGWMLLSGLLKRDGQAQAADRAARIATILQNPAAAAAPAYATPAEFRLGLMERTLQNGAP